MHACLYLFAFLTDKARTADGAPAPCTLLEMGVVCTRLGVSLAPRVFLAAGEALCSSVGLRFASRPDTYHEVHI